MRIKNFTQQLITAGIISCACISTAAFAQVPPLVSGGTSTTIKSTITPSWSASVTMTSGKKPIASSGTIVSNQAELVTTAGSLIGNMMWQNRHLTAAAYITSTTGNSSFQGTVVVVSDTLSDSPVTAVLTGTIDSGTYIATATLNLGTAGSSTLNTDGFTNKITAIRGKYVIGSGGLTSCDQLPGPFTMSAFSPTVTFTAPVVRTEPNCGGALASYSQSGQTSTQGFNYNQ